MRKKIFLVSVAVLTLLSFSTLIGTRVINENLKLNQTPSMVVTDSILAKDINRNVRTISVNDLKNQIGSGVSSVFGRVGDIAALQGDYNTFFYTKTESDSRYVNTTGDIVNGDLIGANLSLNTGGTPEAPLHIESELKESNTYRGIFINSPYDDNFWGALTIQAGLTANQRRYFEYKDNTGTRTNLMGFNALNSFIAYNSLLNYHYISADAGSNTKINSYGANSVIINQDGTPTGSGGLLVLDGTPSGDLLSNGYGSINQNGIKSYRGLNIESLSPNNSNYIRLNTTASNSYLRGSLPLNLISNQNTINFLDNSFTVKGTFDTSAGNLNINGNFIGNGSSLTGVLNSVQAGSNITIDNTDPKNPIINSSGVGVTNLSYISGITNGTVTSDTGTNAVIPTVTSSNAGLQKPDFYEEGTFTPNVTGSYTYTLVTASKKRVGNTVTVTIEMSGINGSGIFSIDNLPYTSIYTGGGILTTLSGSNLSDFQINKAKLTIDSGTTIMGLSVVNGGGFGSISITSGTFRATLIYETNVYTP